MLKIALLCSKLERPSVTLPGSSYRNYYTI